MSPERRLAGADLPPRLADLPQPPRELYLRGELPRGPAVAIVGTRSPTEGARAYTRSLAGELGGAGVAIVSGGAKGIDAAAHEGALAVGAPTVVVAPCGFDRPFPEEHADLFRAVVEHGGAWLSLFACDVPAARGVFFRRNAVLAAIAHVVIVIEAPLRSGALNAAGHARRLGRPLLVAPSAPWNPRGQGCNAELARGARQLLHARQVLKLLAAMGQHPVALARAPVPAYVPAPAPAPPLAPATGAPRRTRPTRPGPGSAPDRQKNPQLPRLAGRAGDAGPARRAELSDSAMDPEARRVLEAVRGGACFPDEVCVAAGLPASRVQQLLLTLTLRGVLVPDLGGRLRLIST